MDNPFYDLALNWIDEYAEFELDSWDGWETCKIFTMPDGTKESFEFGDNNPHINTTADERAAEYVAKHYQDFLLHG